ncbi:MAG: alpha/beta hydrolase [Desulfarculaceae bacterium]|nr:alpha/beta hydrolase [Desulfarculaceae bacterium]MCF8071646.1 alpha/beta hydrolase [Desulfarculaceae bacterium]MCF8102507.1 alpha/beta hydrolase [Desulfarculaceae bacterium]MCF8114925.1 alpha/beta hydrolase [Desulfarculaceae bacterium]
MALAALLVPGLAGAGQGGYAVLDGHKVFYIDQGKGQPAMVLIHGWIGNHKFWKDMIPGLAKGHRVIALDMIGHGQSDAPKLAYTQELLARSVLAVMDRAQLKNAVLVGHSMGAAVARRVALEHPARVRALVSVDGSPGQPPKDPKAREEWAKQANAFMAQFQEPDGQSKVGPFFDAMQDKATPPAVREWIKKQALATPWHVGKSSMKEFVNPANWDGKPLNIPVLAIAVPSQFLPPDWEAQMRALFPDLSYHTITGVGHFLMLEKAAEVDSLILGFVDSKAVRDRRVK